MQWICRHLRRWQLNQLPRQLVCRHWRVLRSVKTMHGASQHSDPPHCFLLKTKFIYSLTMLNSGMCGAFFARYLCVYQWSTRAIDRSANVFSWSITTLCGSIFHFHLCVYVTKCHTSEGFQRCVMVCGLKVRYIPNPNGEGWSSVRSPQSNISRSVRKGRSKESLWVVKWYGECL